MQCPIRELFSDSSSDDSYSEPINNDSPVFPALVYKKKSQPKTRDSFKIDLNPQRLDSPDDSKTVTSKHSVSVDSKNINRSHLPQMLSLMDPPTSNLTVPLQRETPLTNDNTAKIVQSTSLLSSSVPTTVTDAPPSATPPPLDFPLSKILFIFEKMNTQSLSVELLSHATKLVGANKDKIQRASYADVSQLMNMFMKKEVFEEALSQPSIFEMSRTAILILTEAPDYLVPAAMYHRLLEELDMGSHQDYPGLGSILRSFALLPSISKDEGVENQRLTLMTMTYSLLGVWPGSSDLGAAIFRSLFVKPKNNGPVSSVELSTTKSKVHATINLVLRVLAGDAQNVEVDVHAASRVVGNLLNVSEAATRQAVMQEINHLVAYSVKSSEGINTSKTAESEFQKLPGQVGDFLIHLTALTHDKGDKRLDMVGLLGHVLEDHLIAYSGGSEVRLGSTAIRLVLTTLPLTSAADLACEVMLNSSSAHVRTAILGTLVKVYTGSISQGTKNNDAELASSLGLDKKARKNILDLLMLFLAEDPVEKVRIACLEAMETLAAFFTHIDKEVRSGDDSEYKKTSNIEPYDLSTLSSKAFALIVIKLGDISLKVQARAAAILTGGDIEGCKPIQIGSKNEQEKDIQSTNAVSAPQLAFIVAFNGASPQFQSEMANLIFSLNLTLTSADEQTFCPAVHALLKQLVSQIEIPYLPQFNTPDQHMP